MYNSESLPASSSLQKDELQMYKNSKSVRSYICSLKMDSLNRRPIVIKKF